MKMKRKPFIKNENENMRSSSAVDFKIFTVPLSVK